MFCIIADAAAYHTMVAAAALIAGGMMATVCEIVNIEGFQSKLNRRRVELDLTCLNSSDGYFRVGEKVAIIFKDKGVQDGKVRRFVKSAGKFYADVELKIKCLTFLRMIPVVDLESKCACPGLELSLDLSARRNEASRQLGI